MYDRELAKRMLNFLILDILKEYSDEDHRLTQQEILRLLKLNYDVECDRRSVKSNVEALKAFGYEIDMEDGYCLLERDFEESELRMLIDSVLFSKNISQSVAQTLINRLKEQGNRYFRAKVPYIYSLPEMRYADNTQVMYNLDVLNTAIAEKKKVSFVYNSYGTDFKLHPKRKERYVVNPYQLVANNGWYYLVANYDKYNDVSHYRIDKITKIEIMHEKCKPTTMVKEMEKGFSLPRHMAEHIYMRFSFSFRKTGSVFQCTDCSGCCRSRGSLAVPYGLPGFLLQNQRPEESRDKSLSCSTGDLRFPRSPPVRGLSFCGKGQNYLPPKA